MKSEKAFRAYEVAVRLGGQRVLRITVPPRRMGALEPAYTPAPRTPAPRCWQTAAGHNGIHRFRAQTQKAAPVNWQTRLSKPGIAHGYRKQSPSTPRRSQAAIASSAHGNASPFCRCLCLYSRSTSGHGVDTTRAPGGRAYSIACRRRGSQPLFHAPTISGGDCFHAYTGTQDTDQHKGEILMASLPDTHRPASAFAVPSFA